MPVTLERAAALADSWFVEHTAGERRVDLGKTISRPYGWVFFGTGTYTGGSWLFVDRAAGTLREFGSAHSPEFVLATYEARLSDVDFETAPEVPPGASTAVRGDFGLIQADRRIDVAAWPEVARQHFERTRSNEEL